MTFIFTASKFEKSFAENHAVMNGIEDQKSEDGLDSDSVFQTTRSTSEPNLSKLNLISFFL